MLDQVPSALPHLPAIQCFSALTSESKGDTPEEEKGDQAAARGRSSRCFLGILH